MHEISHRQLCSSAAAGHTLARLLRQRWHVGLCIQIGFRLVGGQPTVLLHVTDMHSGQSQAWSLQALKVEAPLVRTSPEIRGTLEQSDCRSPGTQLAIAEMASLGLGLSANSILASEWPDRTKTHHGLVAAASGYCMIA